MYAFALKEHNVATAEELAGVSYTGSSINTGPF